MADPLAPPTDISPSQSGYPSVGPASKPVVSSNDMRDLDVAMGAKAGPSANPLLLQSSPLLGAVNAGRALISCHVGAFCADDAAPPFKMRFEEPVNVAGVKGIFSATPGKFDLTIPLGYSPRKR